MKKLEWDDSYSVGVHDIDAEHKFLFHFINDLQETLLGKKGRETVENVLNGLFNHASSHFIHEEILLYKNGYPEYNAHKAEHDKLLSEFRGCYVAFMAGGADSRLISAEIIAVLTEWLQEHVLKADKAYAHFLKSKAVR